MGSILFIRVVFFFIILSRYWLCTIYSPKVIVIRSTWLPWLLQKAGRNNHYLLWTSICYFPVVPSLLNFFIWSLSPFYYHRTSESALLVASLNSCLSSVEWIGWWNWLTLVHGNRFKYLLEKKNQCLLLKTLLISTSSFSFSCPILGKSTEN